MGSNHRLHINFLGPVTAVICVLVRSVQVSDDYYTDEARISSEVEPRKLGMLILDGYTYATQAGDPDDLRTWCNHYDEKTKVCTMDDEKPLILEKKVVGGYTFSVAKEGNLTSKLAAEFSAALKPLLCDPGVVAIVANCGFFKHWQPFAQELLSVHMQEPCHCDSGKGCGYKPVKLSSLTMVPLFAEHGSGSYDVLPRNSTVVITTANGVSFKQGDVETMVAIHPESIPDWVPKSVKTDQFLNLTGRKEQGYTRKTNCSSEVVKEETVRRANRLKTKIVGMENVPGFGPQVTDGLPHEPFKATAAMTSRVQKKVEKIQEKTNSNVSFILQECTELPVYSSAFRLMLQVPVVDVTDMGKCLVQVASLSNLTTIKREVGCLDHARDVFFTKEFKDCILKKALGDSKSLYGMKPDKGYRLSSSYWTKNNKLELKAEPLDKTITPKNEFSTSK